jgi:diguanylate cyclase (GGDEF)-like protein
MRSRSPTLSGVPRWSRAQLYPAAALGFAVMAGIAVFVVQSLAGGKALYASLWIAIGALLVLGGWLFGRQEDRLRHISVTDSLTGLTNRREFERRMEEELARAERHGLPLSLLLVDVDLLKEINDSGGHREGDRALLAVAEALRGSCRTVDIPARVGGDEFAVLAPTTSGHDALQLAARVQAHLRASRPAGGPRISISIGIADLEAAAEPGADGDLVEAADRALYRAKGGGRDRIALGGSDELEPVDLRSDRSPLRVMPGGKP